MQVFALNQYLMINCMLMLTFTRSVPFRNDFTVKFNRGKPEESVLMLLEQAFYSMSKIVTHGMLSNGKVNERFFYTKLLWG